jgi:hypothetical protein
MTVKLHKAALQHALTLVRGGKFVADERDAWSEHQPSAAEENEFIRRRGFAEYGKWHLGIDDDRAETTKGRYKFPYGDFAKVHRCALLSAESRAGRFKYLDIERAVHRLHQMMPAKRAAGTRPSRRRGGPRPGLRSP